MNSHDIVPLVLMLALVLASTTVFIWALQLRYKRRELLHRERLAALEKGMDLPALADAAERPQAPWSPRRYLLRGLMWAFSGLALSIFVLGVALATHGTESLEERVYRLQRLKSTGVSEEQLKTLAAQLPRERRGTPASMALFGLIPIAVGAAYLVVYYAERKELAPRE